MSCKTDAEIMQELIEGRNKKPYSEKLKELTEQEIKDYDERFWPFAVKVEGELEE